MKKTIAMTTYILKEKIASIKTQTNSNMVGFAKATGLSMAVRFSNNDFLILYTGVIYQMDIEI